MQPYYDLTWKMKYMEIIILDHHLNSLKEKKYTKSKIFLDIEEEDEDINTTSNGKDIQSPKQHGNRKQHFPMMVTCCHNTNNDINFEDITLKF